MTGTTVAVVDAIAVKGPRIVAESTEFCLVPSSAEEEAVTEAQYIPSLSELQTAIKFEEEENIQSVQGAFHRKRSLKRRGNRPD